MILFVPDVQLGISRGKRTARWTVRSKERKIEREKKREEETERSLLAGGEDKWQGASGKERGRISN